MYRVLLIVLVLVLIGLQYRLWISDGSLAEVQRLQETNKTLQSSIVQARARNKALAAEIENLKSGEEAMAGRARSDIGMVKEGETFYLTIEPQKEDNATPDSEQGDGAPADESE